ncbi:DUF2238 domain-containing protein [Psychrobacter pygoscelis]|uniref:DUF2238 domain-containing protein n=1 Tax=Psychrobacter pygoscelis TaxID=2488563 RepID=UPI003BF9B351
MLLASIEPLEWSSYLLHQAGTLIFMAMMLTAYRYLSIGTHAYSLSMLFLLIHIIGARYLYSYVPYDDWSHALLGFKLTDYFGWQRNMYDRLVHFSYGLLLFAAMYNGLKAILRLPSPRQLIAITLLLNMASSMLYELFEWGIAMTLSAEDAEAYNGQQGDMWDAHKDMALALLGGLISAVLYTFTPLKRVLR